MSQVPPKPKPTAGPKRVKPKSPSSMDKDLREMREMPKRVKPKSEMPKREMTGTMGSSYDQARARQQRLVADMRKRMMLRKDKKSN
jgi:hypothetical protein